MPILERAKQASVITLIAGSLLVTLLGEPAAGQLITYTPFATGVSRVTDIAHAGDGRLFVAQQTGEILIVESDGSVLPTPFLDVKSLLSVGFEKGLLGLAFHPDYATNGYFYINYTALFLGGATVVARYQVSPDPNVADPSSSFFILTQSQPFVNHNGGDLNFGPADGYLYIGFGDGGAGCDPMDDAQDGSTFLGKMLRIDVDGGSPYSVPATNPFVGVPGVLDEIWASGLRNPWRFSFDRQAPHDMWIGDVGQLNREEIDHQPGASSGGENYGWDCREGLFSSALAPSSCSTTATCPPTGGATDPIHDYDRSGGRCSVTGGFVYRGALHPDFVGEYFFADWCSQDLYSLRDNGAGYTLTEYTTDVPDNPTTFGEDANGEIYVAAGDTLYRLDDPSPPVTGCPAAPAPTCDVPEKATLVIRDGPLPVPSTKDRIVFKSTKSPAEAQSGFGDPLAGTDYLWCLYSDTGASPALIAEAGVASGAGWKALGTTGYKFADSTGAQDGTTHFGLKGHPAQPKTRIAWKGRGTHLPLPSLPLAQGGPVSVRVHNLSNANCWGADFPLSATKKNDTRTFKAKVP